MEKFYVTTPIFYVNASPHLGHAYADVIADTLARYHRARGARVFFLTGTDEHGAKVSRSAEEAHQNIKKFVDAHAAKFQKLTKILSLSNDGFIRTSDKRGHWPGAEAMWKVLRKSGDIYRAKYKGLYCVGHEAFVMEKDLENGKCPDHDQEPEVIEEENYFFRLSEYAERIRAFIVSDEMRILPEARKNEMLALINDGLKDVSFSRPSKDIPWGIPVPDDPEQTMYVWSDALSNYISALGYRGGGKPSEKMTVFWPADVHVIGKDILRFHALIWPGMLLAAGLPLPRTIFAHGLILSGGRKMSKTLGNVTDPFALQKKYGTDALRNFFVSEIPSYEDGDFTVSRFNEAYNAKFPNGVGNLTSRIAAMIERSFGGELQKPDAETLRAAELKRYIPEVGTGDMAEVRGEDPEFYITEILRPAYERAFKDIKLNEAANIGWTLLKICDGYIQDYEPFKLVKKHKEQAGAVLWNAALMLLGGVQFLAPVMPETAEKIFSVFGVDGASPLSEWKVFRAKSTKPLFPRIGEKD